MKVGHIHFVGRGKHHINFRESLANLGPLISAQLEGALVEVEVPGTKPTLILRADPRDPGQARFLALAIGMSRAAQAETVQAMTAPRWTDALAAALPVTTPSITFPFKSGVPLGLAAFIDAAAALSNTWGSLLGSAMAR